MYRSVCYPHYICLSFIINLSIISEGSSLWYLPPRLWCRGRAVIMVAWFIHHMLGRKIQCVIVIYVDSFILLGTSIRDFRDPNSFMEWDFKDEMYNQLLQNPRTFAIQIMFRTNDNAGTIFRAQSAADQNDFVELKVNLHNRRFIPCNIDRQRLVVDPLVFEFIRLLQILACAYRKILWNKIKKLHFYFWTSIALLWCG